MNYRREFEIAWYGLAPGLHEFAYEIDDFKLDKIGYAKQDWYEKLAVTVKVKFDKKSSFFLLTFDIDGSISLPCDRCGDVYDLPLWEEFELVVKLVNENEDATRNNEDDENGDVVFIPRSQTVIDIADWLYEFVMLSVPIQHIHPENEDGTSGCNQETLQLLNKMSEEVPQAQNTDQWKGLEKLKNLKFDSERNDNKTK